MIEVEKEPVKGSEQLPNLTHVEVQGQFWGSVSVFLLMFGDILVLLDYKNSSFYANPKVYRISAVKKSRQPQTIELRKMLGKQGHSASQQIKNKNYLKS